MHIKAEANRLSNKLKDYKYRSKESYTSMYEELLPIRDEILGLFSVLPYASESIKSIADRLEEFYAAFCFNKYEKENIVKLTLLHELFIYLIAICYKNEMYYELGYLFTRSYYSGEYDRELRSFTVFRSHNDQMDREVCDLDNKRYLCGTAAYWIQHINTEICSKAEFVFADVLSFNASIFVHNDARDYYWFPQTYPYMSDNYDSPMRAFSVRLESREKLEDALRIFGFRDIENFKEKYKEIINSKSSDLQNCRYMNSFDAPQNIFQYMPLDRLGLKN